MKTQVIMNNAVLSELLIGSYFVFLEDYIKNKYNTKVYQIVKLSDRIGLLDVSSGIEGIDGADTPLDYADLYEFEYELRNREVVRVYLDGVVHNGPIPTEAMVSFIGRF